MKEAINMNKKKEDTEIFVGAGNVFEDLGYPNPGEAQAKADLSLQIYQTIKNRKLTQKQAAKIMGIDQPKVSDIIRGKLSKYTIDRLMRYLLLLGRDVEIHVKKHTQRSKPTSLQVFGETKSLPSNRRASA